MPDHIHAVVRADNAEQLAKFIGAYSRCFSLAHNETCHRKGALFESPFGSAPKNGDKKARTNLIYVGNNPVERRICARAEEYRWNFLAYAREPFPFSTPLVLRRASAAMKRAIREVNFLRKESKPLSYIQLKRLFVPLSSGERQQLTDYVIDLYNAIDFAAAIRFFDTYEDMITAMHSNTGSEYDLNEVFVGRDDSYYAKMSSILDRRLKLADIHDVLSFPLEEKAHAFRILQLETCASVQQIAKYLRMPMTKG